MIVYAIEVTVPLANSVATLVRVGSSPTVVGLPVRIDAETWPLHTSSMKTAVGSSVRLPPVSVTCVSDCSWILPGMKPLNDSGDRRLALEGAEVEVCIRPWRGC